MEYYRNSLQELFNTVWWSITEIVYRNCLTLCDGVLKQSSLEYYQNNLQELFNTDGVLPK